MMAHTCYNQDKQYKMQLWQTVLKNSANGVRDVGREKWGTQDDLLAHKGFSAVFFSF